MMKKTFLLFVLTLSSVFSQAQILNETVLQELRSSFKRTPQTTAIQNILTEDANIAQNAINRQNRGKIDHYFKYRVEVKGITDQESSGRCWMFTSMNALRPDARELLGADAFDFSHNYVYFWDMLEKSNLFLENIIRTAHNDINDREVVRYFSSPVGDGGVWNLFYNVAEKYGVVPEQAMPETRHSNNTRQMVSLLNERLRAGGYAIREMAGQGDAEDRLRNQKKEILKDVYRVLALCLGEPPATFSWRYKNVEGEIVSMETTPLEFYRSIIKSDYSPRNYIMVMNDPTREYYKVYEIKNYRNTIEGINWTYLNLPNEEIKPAALASIKDNEPMYTSCDVGKQLDRENGILDTENYDYQSLLGVDLTMDKKARILTRQSGSSHAMLLIACDTDTNEVPVKWEFENSWGPAAGNKGYLTFTDEWFDQYMFRFVIHRKYLSTKAINALDQEPVLLPVWDYMF
ncbi:MAG TPA: C1 family peptidase [Bacteroidales bacterium]|nr:C1 family peptidase [Bacteroidales bacterium]HRW94471.1 C1 family peptidase [Bacteroidales bacterium]